MFRVDISVERTSCVEGFAAGAEAFDAASAGSIDESEDTRVLAGAPGKVAAAVFGDAGGALAAAFVD